MTQINVPLYNFHLPSRVLISLTLAISFIKTVKYPLYLKDQYVPIISHTYTTYYILSSVLWCPLRFSHKNDLRFVFTSGCLSYFRCLRVVLSDTYIVLCFCFVFLLLMYPMLPVSLDCPFLIALRYSLTFIYLHLLNDLQLQTLRWRNG